MTDKPTIQPGPRLRRFLVGLWLWTLLMAVLLPWPYTVAFILLAVCLHFAALDGPLVADMAADDRSDRLSG